MLERFVVHTDARCVSMQHFQDGLPVCHLFIFCRKSPKRRVQDIHPGCDAEEDVPIGYSVTKDALVNMGVIYQ